MPPSKQDRIPQARALYAQGLTLGQVADALAVSISTISRWRKADLEAGLDWDAGRDATRRTDPHAVVAILEAMRLEIARDEELEHAARADALYKLQRTLASIRSEYADVSGALAVLLDWTGWLETRAPQDLRVAIAPYVEHYIEHLKESV